MWFAVSCATRRSSEIAVEGVTLHTNVLLLLIQLIALASVTNIVGIRIQSVTLTTLLFEDRDCEE